MLSLSVGEVKPTFCGRIVPAGWDEEGQVLAVAIATDDRGEFLVRKSPKADQLIAFVKQRVEILAKDQPCLYGAVLIIEVEDFILKAVGH